MPTLAKAIPRRRARRPRNQPVSGRASFPEIHFVKHIDNSRLHREVDRVRRRECLSLLGLGIVLFIFGLLLASQHFQGVRYGYQIEQLKAERTTLEEWNRQLRLEQASLADPQRIDTLARRNLGLTPPKPEQVVPIGGETKAPAESPEFARVFPGANEDPSSDQ